MKTIDIYSKPRWNPNGKVFDYKCSTIRHKTLDEAVKSLSPHIRYEYTKNRRNYFTDGVYNYVAYQRA